MSKPKSKKTKLKRLGWQWLAHVDNPKMIAKIDVKIKMLD